MKGFNINEHGSHLGHVTCTIYINFLCNLTLIGQAVSEKKVFENNGHIHAFSPRGRGRQPSYPWGQMFSYTVLFTHIWMGGHLGHMTWAIYIIFRSPFPRRFRKNLAVIGQAASEEKMFEIWEGRPRTPDNRYPISSLMSIWLWSAKNERYTQKAKTRYVLMLLANGQ